MQIDGCFFQITMPQQNLDRSEIGAGFQQMRGEAVSQRVRMDILAQAGARRCSPAGQPDDLGGDRMVGCVPAIAWKQPHLRFSSQGAPVLPQGFQQLGAQHDVTVLAALATLYVNDHALAVDVADLQMRQLRSAHSGGIQRHENRAIEGSCGGIDQPPNFLRTEYFGQPDHSLRVRSLVNTPGFLERLDEEKPQRTDSLVDGIRGQLSFTEQVGLVLADPRTCSGPNASGG